MPAKKKSSTRAAKAASKRRVGRPEPLIALGKQLREVRIAQGFTSQDQLAYTCGIDRAYYSALERGERNVGILNLMQIALALRVEVGDLVPPIDSLRRILTHVRTTKSST